MGDPVHAPCRPRRAANDSGPRRADDIRFVVVHDTEGGTAASVAAYFARSSTPASTQLVVDDTECYRCVPDLVRPWGAPGANLHGLHVEHCGYASWTRAQWLEHEAMLKRAAWKVGRWCWQYRIPRRWLTDTQLRAGQRGLTTHGQCSRVFNGGWHTDPGAGFPKAHYLSLVVAAYREISDERRLAAKD